MSFSVQIPPGQIASAKELLSGIKDGYPRAMTRALNYGARQAKSLTAKQLKALITADPERIDKSLTVSKANYSTLTSSLTVYGKAIPLFRFDVAFMYPTVTGGVTANIFKSGGGKLALKHAFIAKMENGHVGVFYRSGPKTKVGRGKYEGQLKQRIYESFGPNAATAFERTPGVETEIIDQSATNFEKEFLRQVDFLLAQSQGNDPPDGD